MPDEVGIKSWQRCPACDWEDDTIHPNDHVDVCPNCGFAEGLYLEVDFNVWNGTRYEGRVRNKYELADEMAWIARENRPIPKKDKVKHKNNGYQFGEGEKPNYKPKPDRRPKNPRDR